MSMASYFFPILSITTCVIPVTTSSTSFSSVVLRVRLVDLLVVLRFLVVVLLRVVLLFLEVFLLVTIAERHSLDGA